MNYLTRLFPRKSQPITICRAYSDRKTSKRDSSDTGNDFVYHDDFAMSADEYAEASGSVDELGNKYIKNMDSNGRFHSDWCSMIYSRLMVARSLLKEDGVIFISIGVEEFSTLKSICNEVFGENNFVEFFLG